MFLKAGCDSTIDLLGLKFCGKYRKIPIFTLVHSECCHSVVRNQEAALCGPRAVPWSSLAWVWGLASISDPLGLAGHLALLRGKHLWRSSSHCRFAANTYGGLITARTVGFVERCVEHLSFHITQDKEIVVHLCKNFISASCILFVFTHQF